MTSNSRYTRRRLLQLTGSLAAIGLAGCTGTTDDSGSGSGHHDDGSNSSKDSGHHDDGPNSSKESGHHDDGSNSEGDSGHHDDGGHSEAIGAPSDAADVAMVTKDGNFHFEPHVVRVNVGGTVTWTNESGSHSTTAYHPDNDQPQLVPDGATSWDSGLLSDGGATFEHTFETEGVYHYYCTPHETSGMIGSVIVGEPDPHEQNALGDVPADKPKAVREKLTELNEKIKTALGDHH